jgi:hypothetical protein
MTSFTLACVASVEGGAAFMLMLTGSVSSTTFKMANPVGIWTTGLNCPGATPQGIGALRQRRRVTMPGRPPPPSQVDRFGLGEGDEISPLLAG